MKHFLCCLFVLLCCFASYGQSFELVDRQETYQAGLSQTINIPLKIKNITDKPQVYVFRKIQDDLGGSRKGYFCWQSNCLDADVDEFTKKLEPGETIQNLNFTIETGLLTGIHTVKFEISPRGITGQSIEHVISLAIEERPAKARVFSSKEITLHDVYPNPVTDQAYIEYNVHNDQIKCKVLIHNIIGKILGDYDLPASDTKVKILTEDMPAGVYFYTLYLNNEGVMTRKLIVRK